MSARPDRPRAASAGGATGAAAGPRRTRPSWQLGLMLGVALAAGGGLAVAWQRARLRERALWQAPAVPDLAGRPAELVRRLTTLQQRLAANPSALPAWAEIGRLYHANHFVNEARTCWLILHRAQPAEGRWPYHLADLARSEADEDGLRHWLETTVALAPDYAPAWLQLADLEFKSGRLDAAETAYRKRLGLVPRDPYASLGLARIALQRGQRDEGRRALEEITHANPQFSSARNVYAELLAQQNDLQGAANQRWLGTIAGRFRAADDPWAEELQPACYDADQLIVWGEIDFQTNRGDRGKSFFERAVACAPESSRTYEKLGRFYLDTGDPAKGRDVLEKARALPGVISEPLYVELSEAYLDLHQTDEALRAADEGLAAIPDSASLCNARGLSLAAAHRLPEAIAAYEAAMARSPSSPDPVANLGFALLEAGRRDEGRTRLKQALELQPRYAKALVALARLDLESGQLKSAAQSVFPYFQQFPGLHVARELMSRLYLSLALEAAGKGDAAAVERICLEGIGIIPESAELHGFLGTNYVQQHRFPEALDALEKARRLQPNDPRITLALGQLYVQQGRVADARELLQESERLARNRGDTNVAERLAGMLRSLPQ